MKIIFAAINARYIHSNPAVCYLKKYIADLNYKTEIMEFTIKEKPETIAMNLAKGGPSVIAFSVYIWNSRIISEVVAVLRTRFPDIILVAGGPDVSYNPDYFFISSNPFDYIISGPGEEGFRKLALLSFSSDERIIEEKNSHFSQIPFPYNDTDMLRMKNRFVYYESSRGCPFRCSYCLSSRSDQGCQYRETGTVKNEIDYICSFSPHIVKFVDRTFNSRREHFRSIWEHIADRHSGGSTLFHFEIFPELLNDDDINFLKNLRPGLFQFEAGIQSTKQEALEAVQRSGNWEKTSEVLGKIALAGNIHLHVDLIAGLPYENYREFALSFDRVHNLKAEHFQCGFLKILPGTEMKEKAGDYGIICGSEAPYEIESTLWLNAGEVKMLKRIAGLNDLIRNSGRFATSLSLLTELYGSPFVLYENLALISQKYDRGGITWEWGAEAMLNLCFRDFPSMKDELLDSLRWDWCLFGKTHNYPAVIKSDITVKTKREGYRFFIELSRGGIISYEGAVFSGEKLRKSIFFRPLTPSFMEKNMKAPEALFLPDKRIIFFNRTSGKSIHQA